MNDSWVYQLITTITHCKEAIPKDPQEPSNYKQTV